MICNARHEGWPVIDCTPSVMIVHQNHDYSHLPGGAPHYSAPESNENMRLAGGHAAIRYTVLDATHVLQNGALAPPPPSVPASAALEILLRSVFYFLPSEKSRRLPGPSGEEAVAEALGRKNRGSNDGNAPADHG